MNKWIIGFHKIKKFPLPFVKRDRVRVRITNFVKPTYLF
ncbi:hypothetical protein A45J_1565 [hot springs metagenome]|uniref:Uncharacterized protein n=1 Tax=hot springs metagenome TaxID=433727 RepID=A0A5J4L6M2_9ZZZZ